MKTSACEVSAQANACVARVKAGRPDEATGSLAAVLARPDVWRGDRIAVASLPALAKKGVIVLDPSSARGIRLVEQLGLPLIGSVAAGSPLLAVENRLGRIQIASQLFTPRADYVLQVRGNSMTGAGILDGDLLAVHKTAEARSGQIVVARLGDEVTVKRLRRKGSRLELVAENPDYAPIVVDGPLAIEGLAVGLIRNGSTL